MKILKNTLGTILMATLILTSCNKNENDDIFIETPPTAQEFQNLKEAALENLTQEFQFNAEDGSTTFTSVKGVQLTINGTCLSNNGSAVAGSVVLEFVELFEKGNMLITNKPTMGLLPNGDKAMLISGGEFFINATQNGEDLDINCSIQLIVPSALSGGTDPAMSLWNGIIDEDDNLEWGEVNADPAGNQGGVFAEGGQYYAFLDQFGWSNVDRFYNDPRPKTTLQISVPEGYDNENSSVYLSYDGEETGLANMDTYDPGTKLFSEHYGQIPIGLECHVIFVSEDNGLWKYAIKAVTIVNNGIITFTDGETSSDIEAVLVASINGLP